jgi:hypothetical protein
MLYPIELRAPIHAATAEAAQCVMLLDLNRKVARAISKPTHAAKSGQAKAGHAFDSSRRPRAQIPGYRRRRRQGLPKRQAQDA